MENLLFLGVPIIKHIRVIWYRSDILQTQILSFAILQSVTDNIWWCLVFTYLLIFAIMDIRLTWYLHEIYMCWQRHFGFEHLAQDDHLDELEIILD